MSLRPLIFTSTTVRVVESHDYPGDPAPYVEIEFPAAQLGNGRCQCGRKTPALVLSANLEEEEAIALAQSILRFYAEKKARAADRARLAERIRRDRSGEV